MTLDKEDEFIQRIMANHDAAMAAAAESTTYMATSEGTLVEREVEVRQSKSPLGAPVFFIKKKDGKLRFVQDS
jgi:hypothetical protein